jgi:topoisomerase-4 subunit A
MVADMKGRLLIASTWGRGFITNIADVVAETKKGRQVVNLKGDAKLLVVRPVPEGADHVAAIGENRKLVVFALSEMPEMAKGQGVMLQRYKDGGLSDATVFKLEEGLSWPMGGETGRTRTENDLTMWRVARGAAGRLPPTGFPKTGKFD